MEINGKEVDEQLAKVFEQLKSNATPETEAAFKAEEEKRLKQEALSRVENSNEYANIPKRFWFASFSDYPSKLTDEARELCLTKDTDVIYILSGSTGQGKTTLLCSAIHARAYEGLGGSRYFTVRNLEMKLRKCRNFNSDEDEETFIRHLSNYPFLCIDEVGTCFNKVDEINFLRAVISERFDNCLPTWIATNLTPIQFKAYICNVDITGKNDDELAEISKELDSNNVIMNRIKQVAKLRVLEGPSHRGVKNDGED